MAADESEPGSAIAAGSGAQPVLRLDPSMAVLLGVQLPEVAEQTVAAIILEVPGYADALTGRMGDNIQQAVRMALGGFLELAVGTVGSDPSSPLGPALDAAYALGRGEARSGRSMDALLAAYRVGARVAWRGLARSAVGRGLEAQPLADFAELVFAYIDQLSAASVSGHSDELATTGRVRQRYREQLARTLVDGASPETVTRAAERADWTPPQTLTAVLLPGATYRTEPSGLPAPTLRLDEDSTDGTAGRTVLLVPDADGAERGRLLQLLGRRRCIVGPARPWLRARASYLRAVRAEELGSGGANGRVPIDTEQHLVELVLSADQEALTDLREQALAPLDGLRPDSAEKLRQTLRSWLLHHGRRDDVAAELFVHPQTVRYRMGQLRELYPDALSDPEAVLRLTMALAIGRNSPQGGGVGT